MRESKRCVSRGIELVWLGVKSYAAAKLNWTMKAASEAEKAAKSKHSWQPINAKEIISVNVSSCLFLFIFFRP